MPTAFEVRLDGLFQGPPIDNIMANGENWDLASNPERKALGIPTRLDMVQDPLGQKGVVLRSTMYDTDPPTAGVEVFQVRAECDLPTSVFGEYWYAFDALIFRGEWPDTGAYSIWQHHKQNEPNSAQPFAIVVDRETLGVVVPVDGIMPSTYGVYTRRTVQVAPFAYGQWHRVVLHANWSITTAGYRELFLDGVRVWRETGVITAYDEPISGYSKVGIYNVLGLTTPGWKMARAYHANVVAWQGVANYETGLGSPLRPPPREVFIG